MARAHGRQATRNERQPLPFWVGLVAGFFLGIVVASVFIYRDYNLERQRNAGAAGPQSQPTLAPPVQPRPSLPPALTQPIAAPGALRPETPAPLAASPTLPTPTPTPAAPAPPSAAPATTGGRSLVAGSLRSRSEAEQRKAELALLGVSSRVIETTVNGERYFRVTVGPFRTEQELKQMRAQLEANGINPFVLGN